MTPRRLDVGVVHGRLRLMRDLLDDLDGIGEVTVERLERDRLTRHAVERVLSSLVDLAVAVNGHVGAARVGRGPEDYTESFGLAARAGAIDDDLARELAPSAGLRNVLVHEYVTIDLALVAASVPRARDGYGRYVAQVARFLVQDVERRPGPTDDGMDA